VSWSPTHSHLRATTFGAVLLVVGVVLGRADAVVLAAPFAIVALWAVSARPDQPLQVSASVTALSVREGEEFGWQPVVTTGTGVRQVVTVLPDQLWLEASPDGGIILAAHTGQTPLRIAIRSTRWGRRSVRPAAFAAYGVWNAWRAGPVVPDPLRLTTLPLPAPPRADAPTPHPHGLVGMERAARVGEGTEFAKVRAFQPGDRLRRIHWPVSARTGRLHVTATYADEDALVVVLLDAVNDIGESGGVDGAESSMDVAVRAAASVAEHFLQRGDRVGLRAFGAWGVSRVPAGSGRLHLRRIIDTLCLVEPGSARGEAALSARLGLGAGSLAVMLSPFVDPAAAQQVVTLARAGLDVIAVDTLPELVPVQVPVRGDDRRAALAWRIRMLERRLELEAIAALGIPVVRWQGPASLDMVLRDLSRRRAAPRAVGR
jgi:uncharacterized protein (DUF58 family)